MLQEDPFVDMGSPQNPVDQRRNLQSSTSEWWPSSDLIQLSRCVVSKYYITLPQNQFFGFPMTSKLMRGILPKRPPYPALPFLLIRHHQHDQQQQTKEVTIFSLRYSPPNSCDQEVMFSVSRCICGLFHLILE